MKNLLKKLGVIGLIVAMLLPFVELPVVNAATEGCTDHTLQQYYFLDRLDGAAALESYKGDGRTTGTMFPYLFPETSGKSINIMSVDVEYLNDSSFIESYWDEMTHLGGDYDYYEKKSSVGKVGAFSTDKGYDDTYYTSILHGKWGVCEDSDCDSTKLNAPSGWTKDNISKFKKNSIQKAFNGTIDEDNITIRGGRFNTSNTNTKLSGVSTYKYRDLKDYFQAVANKTDSELVTEVDGNEYLGLTITRSFSSSQIQNDFTYGIKCGAETQDGDRVIVGGNCPSGKKYAYLKYSDFLKYGTGDYTSSSAITTNKIGDTTTTVTFSDEAPDYEVNDIKYWPVILNVEYEVCPTSSSPEKGQWTLKYDGNTDDTSVTNIPSSQTRDENTDITVDSKTPSRSGYTFKGWNTKSDGSGDSYKANDTFKYPGAGTYTLFAQWGKSGSEDNKKTGVISYVIGFISTGIVAGGIYLLAKKKNLFKQI